MSFRSKRGDGCTALSTRETHWTACFHWGASRRVTSGSRRPTPSSQPPSQPSAGAPHRPVLSGGKPAPTPGGCGSECVRTRHFRWGQSYTHSGSLPLLSTPMGPACHRGHAKTHAQISDPCSFQSKASRLWGITPLPRSGSALTNSRPHSLPE